MPSISSILKGQIALLFLVNSESAETKHERTDVDTLTDKCWLRCVYPCVCHFKNTSCEHIREHKDCRKDKGNTKGGDDQPNALVLTSDSHKNNSRA